MPRLKHLILVGGAGTGTNQAHFAPQHIDESAAIRPTPGCAAKARPESTGNLPWRPASHRPVGGHQMIQMFPMDRGVGIDLHGAELEAEKARPQWPMRSWRNRAGPGETNLTQSGDQNSQRQPNRRGHQDQGAIQNTLPRRHPAAGDAIRNIVNFLLRGAITSDRIHTIWRRAVSGKVGIMLSLPAVAQTVPP